MHNGNFSQFNNRLSFLRNICSVFVFATALVLGGFTPSANSAFGNDTHLYFITSEGCAPCRQVEPAIEALQREGYPVTTVHYGQHEAWARELGVDRTPTVVMITESKMVGRHAGIIDAVTLKKWFAYQGVEAGKTFADSSGKKKGPGGTKVVLDDPADSVASRIGKAGFPPDTSAAPGAFSSSTMLKGTRKPKNASEQIALNATVRLKVNDPKGTSYATGTVIHSYQGESLVVTCGHVFRDARGKGEITAEYGFAKGQTQTAPGELVFYDADARDIGLVVIRTSDDIEPVRLAAQGSNISKGRGIFSIGCDNGDDPTIRRSKIKNKAAYDGSIKYDIFGRPVNGRSGGGLFTEKGELIGVCNAAAVEVDEGIYSALDTIYWQIAKVNLNHLFDPNTAMASGQSRRDSNLSLVASSNNAPVRIKSVTPISNSDVGQTSRDSGTSRLARIESRPGSLRTASLGSQRTPVSWNRGQSHASAESDKEVIILVRSKSDPSQTETITIGDPTPKLLDYLESMNSPTPRNVDVARLRMEN